ASSSLPGVPHPPSGDAPTLTGWRLDYTPEQASRTGWVRHLGRGVVDGGRDVVDHRGVVGRGQAERPPPDDRKPGQEADLVDDGRATLHRRPVAGVAE